jgi:hypothetical protein
MKNKLIFLGLILSSLSCIVWNIERGLNSLLGEIEKTLENEE